MKNTILAVLALVIVTATVCLAGSMWKLKCENPKCKFSGRVDVGGVTLACEATGYCTTCREFVTISWKRPILTGDFKKLQDGDKTPGDKPPQELGTVWNPATGKIAALYPCPKCKKPFMEIDVISLAKVMHDTLLCPRCTNLTLTVQNVGNID